MKKTLIAAGIAAVMAVPAFTQVASADVKVSGQVKYTFASRDSEISTTGDSIGADNSITVSSSEDLGNGMTAFASLTIDSDASSFAGGSKDQVVGLKGAFGAVTIGYQESVVQGKISSRFDDGASSTGAVTQLESNLTDEGRDSNVLYQTPTVNGFSAAVQTIDTVGSTGGGYRDIGTAYAVFYDNGPLSIAAGMHDMEAANSDASVIAVSYTMGDAKVSLGRYDQDGATNDADDTVVRLDYKLGGGNSLILGYRDGEGTNGVDRDVLSVKLTHSFSKQTAIWAGVRNVDDGGADGDGNVAHAGMIHKF